MGTTPTLAPSGAALPGADGLPIVIIGAGLAGWTTAREFRKLDAVTPVVVITADSGDFYAKPTLSNAFAQKRTPAQLVTTPAAKMVETLNVSLLPHTRVLAIDTAARTVRTAQGDIGYGRLALATGATPIRVPLRGDALDQMLSVNTLDDFAAFHARLTGPDGASSKPGRIVVMGAGLIGCEFANDLAGAGFEVCVVDPGERPLAALLPEAASAQLLDALGRLGVAWHFGTTVSAVDHAGTALRVTLANGQSLDADLVLSAIGLRADTALAQAAGIACERGIVVDAQLRTSAPDVFALGDGAQYAPGLWSAAAVTGGRTLPYVMPIMSAARVLAGHLAGQTGRLAFPVMPVAIKTPSLPLVVAPPAPGTSGDWREIESGEWQWLDAAGARRGFALSGAATARRSQAAAALAVAA